MKHPLVSIIVTIYNAEQYLDKCVQSLINQTYSNIEILLVNDGSTDKSAVICDALQLTDPRIHVRHKANGGVSTTRNAGLEMATGDYIGFVDSDDYVDAAFVSTLLHNLQQYDADISECGIILSTEEAIQTDEVIRTLNPQDWIEETITKTSMYSSCSRLFKKELVKDFIFKVGSVYEDVFFILDMSLKAQKIVSSNLKLYTYFVENNVSITRSAFNLSRLARVDASIYQYKFLISNNYSDAIIEIGRQSIINMAEGCYLSLFDHSHLDPDKKYRQAMKSVIKQFINTAVDNNRIKLIDTIPIAVFGVLFRLKKALK